MYTRGIVARVVDVCIHHERCRFETAARASDICCVCVCVCIYVSVDSMRRRRRVVRQGCGYLKFFWGEREG